ncbi:MAG: sensor domain-containing protein [Acidimicrobiia bacterium]
MTLGDRSSATGDGRFVRALERSPETRLAALEQMVQASRDAFLATDREGCITYFSAGAERLYGYTVHEALGQHISTLASETSRLDHRELVAQIGRGLAVGPIETERTRHDGSTVWVEILASPLWGPRGTVVGMVSVHRDMTKRHEAERALAEIEARFRGAMQSAAVGMCICDRGGQFLQANAALCRFFGRSERDLLQCTWMQLTHPNDVALDAVLAAKVLDGSLDHYRLRKRFVRANGEVVWGDLAVAGVPTPLGNITQVVAQVVDVTAEVEAGERLAAAHELLETVLDHSEDGTLQFGPDLRVRFANEQVVALTGIPAERWVGARFAELGFSAERAAMHEANIAKVFQTGEPLTYEFEVDDLAGHRHYEARIAPVLDANDRVVSAIETSRDVTDRVEAEARMADIATHDPLTGLANRIELNDEIRRALARTQRAGGSMAVLLMDLDGFKFVNDSLGHAAGDELIKVAADRLQEVVRTEDLLARAGGDEFVVVMRDLPDPEAAFACAWRIVESFRAPFDAAGAELYSTASVGVAVSTPETVPEDLMREADTAMYRAKSEGGDRIAVFNEELRETVFRRVALEAQLRLALESAEIEVWFQPEVDLVTGHVVAAEALVRWRHPSGEVWAAEQFIDVAEETGLILPIGNWVIAEACRAAAGWNAANEDEPITLRVNLSALQLSDEHCLEVIDRALAESGLAPERMCTEITETSFLRRSKVVHDNLGGLHARGIRVASDDFGTGYASLAQLRDYPVDVVKIDQSFIADLVDDDRSRRLVAGTIALAHRLGMQVTAEGVEQQTQAAVLRSLGCDTAQGFLYARALPSVELADYVANSRRP